MLTTLLSNSKKAVAKTLLLYVVSCREFSVNFCSQLAPLNLSLQLKHTFVGSSADSSRSRCSTRQPSVTVLPESSIADCGLAPCTSSVSSRTCLLQHWCFPASKRLWMSDKSAQDLVAR
ncbi:TPA: hypothetical protein ACH3X3_012515 [Trebouxia sp. C0006]